MFNKPQGRTEVVTVTPEMAKRWLENTRNRKLSERTVGRYAEDMVHDRWTFNGEALKFDVNGVLIDGQHRLTALMQANVTLPFLVVHGLLPEAQLSMDQPRKRNLGDQLFMAFGIPQGGKVASFLNEVARWEDGRWASANRNTVTVARGLELYEEYPQALHYVQVTDVRATALGISVSHAVWAGFAFITDSIDPESSEVFHHKLSTGVGLKEDEATYNLRRLWINWASRGSTHTRMEMYRATMIKGWNAHMEGRAGPVSFKPGANEAWPVPVGVEELGWVKIP